MFSRRLFISRLFVGIAMMGVAFTSYAQNKAPVTETPATSSSNALVAEAFGGGNTAMIPQAKGENAGLPACTNEGYTFSGQQVILNTDASKANQQHFFVLQNVTNYTIMLNHQDARDAGASAGWGSKLNGGMVSILALQNRPRFALNCLAYNPPHFGFVSCQSVLNVCSYVAPNNPVGSFWVGENFPATQVAQAFNKRGIHLK